MSAIACPHCQGSIAIDTSIAGQVVSCPHCAGQLTMPQLGTAVTPPATTTAAESFQPTTLPPVMAATSPTQSSPRRQFTGRQKKQQPTALYILGGLGVLLFLFCGIVGALLPNRQQGGQGVDGRNNAVKQRKTESKSVEQQEEPQPKSEEPSTPRYKRAGVTMYNYRWLYTSMTESEVYERLGTAGEERSSSGTLKIVVYEDGKGGVISVTYRLNRGVSGKDELDWRLVSNSQFGVGS